MIRLRKKHHLNIDVQKWGSIFAKCIICEYLKYLISKLVNHNNSVFEYEMKLRKHILHQESCRNLCHTWRIKFVQSKEEFPCVIHDKMDHVKIDVPRLQCVTKWYLGLDNCLLLSHVAHGHGTKYMLNIQMSCGQMIPISQLDLCCGSFALLK